MTAATGAGRDQDANAVGLQLRRLREAPVRDWIIRFGFGAAVSAIAGIVSAVAGPRAGGMFLAFPAILLASLTLVAKEEGIRQARDDARGAAIGTVGLLAFAAVTAVTVSRWPLWLALLTATLAWTVVAVGSYFVIRALGAGDDEPSQDRSGPQHAGQRATADR